MSMIRRATFEILAAAMGEFPSLPQGSMSKVAHRWHPEYEKKPGYLYVRSRAISSRTNDNFDNFPADEIKEAWQTFIGKPVFVNHHNANHRRARGVMIDATLHEDIAPDGSPDTWVEVLMEVDAMSFPKLAKAVISGKVNRTSMGTSVGLSVCSFCGNEAQDAADFCRHIPAMKGQRIVRTRNGKREAVLVYEICKKLSFFENSLLVEDPADPTAAAWVDNADQATAVLSTAASKDAVTLSDRVNPKMARTMSRTASQRSPELMAMEWAALQAQPHVSPTRLEPIARKHLSANGYERADDVEVNGNMSLEGGRTGLNSRLADHLVPEITLGVGTMNVVGLLHEVAHVLAVGYPWLPQDSGHDARWRSIYASLLRSEGVDGAEALIAALEGREASQSTRFTERDTMTAGLDKTASDTWYAMVYHIEYRQTAPSGRHAVEVVDDDVYTSIDNSGTLCGLHEDSIGRNRLSYHDESDDIRDVDCQTCLVELSRRTGSRRTAGKRFMEGRTGSRKTASFALRKPSGDFVNFGGVPSVFLTEYEAQQYLAFGYEDEGTTVVPAPVSSAPIERGPDEEGEDGLTELGRTLRDRVHRTSSRKTAAVDVNSLPETHVFVRLTSHRARERWERQFGEAIPLVSFDAPSIYAVTHEVWERYQSGRSIPGVQQVKRAPDLSLYMTPIGWHQGSRKTALGEQRAPREVDTLREDSCPVCTNSSWDGESCNQCGFIKPPLMFRDPDLDQEKADLRAEVEAEEVDLACDNCGAVYPADDPDANDSVQPRTAARDDDDDDDDDDDSEDDADEDADDPEDDSEDDEPNPWEPDGPEAPRTVSEPQTTPDMPGEDSVHEHKPERGDLCPSCGSGTLMPKDELEGIDPEDTSVSADAEAQTPEDDNSEGEPKEASRHMSTNQPNRRQRRQAPPQQRRQASERPMRPREALHLQVQAMRDENEENAREFRQSLASLQRAVSERDKQISSLSRRNRNLFAALADVAKGAKTERVASLIRVADAANSANGEAVTPAASDDVESQGAAPASANTSVTPDATTDLTEQTQALPENGQVLDDQMEDVTELSADSGPPQGDDALVPAHDNTTSPVTDKSADEDVQWSDSKTSSARLMSSVRLARLQVKAGLAQGDDLVLGQKIAMGQRSDTSIREEIEVLSKVAKRTASQDENRVVSRRAVPRSERSTPSLAPRTSSASNGSSGVSTDVASAVEDSFY